MTVDPSSGGGVDWASKTTIIDANYKKTSVLLSSGETTTLFSVGGSGYFSSIHIVISDFSGTYDEPYTVTLSVDGSTVASPSFSSGDVGEIDLSLATLSFDSSWSVTITNDDDANNAASATYDIEVAYALD